MNSANDIEVKAKQPGLTWRAVECTFFFVLLPIVIYWQRDEFSRLIIPVLLLTGPVCLGFLIRDRSFERRRLWNAGAAFRHLPVILIRLVVLSLPLIAWVYFLEHERFFQFPRVAPKGWLIVMCFYPLLSVYPQEIIFRAFFFHRYKCLFPTPTRMIIASALAFGMAHIFFGHWIAVSLSILGGALFAITYHKTRSTLASVIEHGLWGDFLFTVGLGWYFYGGSIGG